MDKDLTLRAAQGDAMAFGDLCQANRIALLQTAQQIVRDPTAAEDILQEALLECYVKISELRAPDRILAWIRGVIRNRCYNYLRRKRTTPFPTTRFEREPARTSSPLDQLESAEEHEYLHQALDHLSEKNRRAIELFYLHEKSVKEVSHLLGISVGATRVRLNRSRILLKELLTQVFNPRTMREESPMAKTPTDNMSLTCSFCGISVEDLELLITGPGVNICSSCVQACIQVMISKHDYSLQLAPQLSDSVATRISGNS
jgi:RNA polymerase sigma-70 factor, ECF subfamily